jgi:hypothetical protein
MSIVNSVIAKLRRFWLRLFDGVSISRVLCMHIACKQPLYQSMYSIIPFRYPDCEVDFFNSRLILEGSTPVVTTKNKTYVENWVSTNGEERVVKVLHEQCFLATDGHCEGTYFITNEPSGCSSHLLVHQPHTTKSSNIQVKLYLTSHCAIIKV